MFRRKSAEASEQEAATEAAEATRSAVQPEAEQPVRRPKGYTPSKKELGVVTPKRPSPRVRRPNAQSLTAVRKPLTKEERRALREERRERRREITEGIRRGDPKYLGPRDRGPERALVRDIVDARRTVGTWFFGGALVVLLGSSPTMPELVRLGANILWALLALAVIVDSVLICRRVKRLVRERFPKTEERLGSLYLYAVMRALTFRRLRIPMARKSFGDPV